jgi:hypothetical protein
MKPSHKPHIERDCIPVAEEAFKGLLAAFREGRVDKAGCLKACLREMSRLWDERFPGLPEEPFAYASLKGVSRRGVRDAYLKGIIVRLLGTGGDDGQTIINPVCVGGRHARDLARRLVQYRIVATDIRSEMNRFYEHIPFLRTPENYHFKCDDIFEPTLHTRPKAVVFFGACGSLSDAAMDYAIESQASCVICRTCCHDNIGGNTGIIKRFNLLNVLFRFKNLAYAHACKRKTGEYFSEKYSAETYPRSTAAGELSTSAEFVEIARRTVDSDLCRTLIDLDRYLHMAEAGYDVWYRAEMFVAQSRQTRE